ncbi:MAG TPA: class I SAM-dependent methyltransferase [Chitinophagaceae bacterium]|nr:class I SAM-dependent methyltransferase [Chitinophagaceae bacterium]
MQHDTEKYLMFRNRLAKVYKHLSKQAIRHGVSCYRIYNHDLPEFPFIIERFEDKVYVSEYRRRHGMEQHEHALWMDTSVSIIMEVLNVGKENIIVRLRERKETRSAQYQKISELKQEHVVHEQGLRFIVNLSDYLDTGLFLDHRITRAMVRSDAAGKNVLNLFCYTGSFSVYAVAGKAATVMSVDLSKTYLNWAVKNMQLNFPDYKHHQIVHADVKQYLPGAASETFDLIIMDPPTFSNSKRMEDHLDIQQDHVALINECMRILKPEGILYFSTNFTRFKLDESRISASAIKDITKATTPFDFAGKINRFCFRIEK